MRESTNLNLDEVQALASVIALSGVMFLVSDDMTVLSQERRKIIERLQTKSLTVTEIKQPFRVSLVAISKHLKVLERANLIRRQKMGREHIVVVKKI